MNIAHTGIDVNMDFHGVGYFYDEKKKHEL